MTTPGSLQFGPPLRNRLTLLSFALALLGTGCAQYANLVERPTSSEAKTKDQRAFQQSVERQAKSPLDQIARYLDAADAARLVLKGDKHNPDAQSDYSFAVARVIATIREAKLQPWIEPIGCPSGDRAEPWTLSARDLDPRMGRGFSDFEFLSATEHVDAGEREGGRTIKAGLGAPVVVASKDPAFAEPGDETIGEKRYHSMTAVIRFNGRKCELVLVDPREEETVELGGGSYPLAADFHAPLALGIADLEPQASHSGKLFKPDQFEQTARIGQLEAYDPDKIPVLFIHGLGNSVATWIPLIEALRDDRQIRQHYQFVFFTYPSDLPYPISAAILRQELDRFRERYPDHRDFVVVGHSMGGMISRLLITYSGFALWDSLFDKPPEDMPFHQRTREVMEETLIFDPRPEIARVIFVSASHRGSKDATTFLGRLGAKLLGNPISADQITNEALRYVRPDRGSGRRVAERDHIPNAIEILDPDSPFLKKVNTLPLKSDVPYHSIIADRGKGGNLDRIEPVSSDGIVPYWSSHIDGAASETVVPSGHWSHHSEEGQEEISRILMLHLRKHG